MFEHDEGNTSAMNPNTSTRIDPDMDHRASADRNTRARSGSVS
jgi:hypothetical protein